MLRPRIAFLTFADAKDKRSWSGIPYYMAAALERNLGSVTRFHAPDLPIVSLPLKSYSKIRRHLGFKNFDYQHSVLLSKCYANQIQNKINANDFDLIFAPAASTLIAYLNTKIPIVYLSDTTFSNMIDYYPGFSRLTDNSIRQGNEIERLALNKASVCIFSSSWAADSAIHKYGITSDKVKVIPFGANLDQPPEVELSNGSNKDLCRLLFLGVNWERKGGPIAVDCFRDLQARGIECKLTVCGCVPPEEYTGPGIEVIPFLDKNNPLDLIRFNSILNQTDFLILPTRSECYGIVFCEASAYGIPAITTDTGGVSSAVRNGINGYSLPSSATGQDYARVISNIFNNQDEFVALRKSSRALFDSELNWDAWAQTTLKYLDKVLNEK